MRTLYDRDGRYLGKLADVFGDPTRRSVYRQIREARAPVTATEVADVVGVHRTVARAHLERLVELDLVECGVRRRAAGGRPAKTYAATPERLEIMLPPRRYERLSRLLLQLVAASLDPVTAARATEALGRAYGEEAALAVAGESTGSPVRLPPRAVIDWMEDAGYGVSSERENDGTVVLTVHNCVYRELALDYPDIICAFDQAMICGMLGADSAAHRRTHALSAGDDVCRHEFGL